MQLERGAKVVKMQKEHLIVIKKLKQELVQVGVGWRELVLGARPVGNVGVV